MNSSLFHAGRATHLKIVAVSIVCVIVVVLVGINARTSDLATTQIRTANGVAKADQPARYAGQEGKISR